MEDRPGDQRDLCSATCRINAKPAECGAGDVTASQSQDLKPTLPFNIHQKPSTSGISRMRTAPSHKERLPELQLRSNSFSVNSLLCLDDSNKKKTQRPITLISPFQKRASKQVKMKPIGLRVSKSGAHNICESRTLDFVSHNIVKCHAISPYRQRVHNYTLQRQSFQKMGDDSKCNGRNHTSGIFSWKFQSSIIEYKCQRETRQIQNISKDFSGQEANFLHESPSRNSKHKCLTGTILQTGEYRDAGDRLILQPSRTGSLESLHMSPSDRCREFSTFNTSGSHLKFLKKTSCKSKFSLDSSSSGIDLMPQKTKPMTQAPDHSEALVTLDYSTVTGNPGLSGSGTKGRSQNSLQNIQQKERKDGLAPRTNVIVHQISIQCKETRINGYTQAKKSNNKISSKIRKTSPVCDLKPRSILKAPNFKPQHGTLKNNRKKVSFRLTENRVGTYCANDYTFPMDWSPPRIDFIFSFAPSQCESTALNDTEEMTLAPAFNSDDMKTSKDSFNSETEGNSQVTLLKSGDMNTEQDIFSQSVTISNSPVSIGNTPESYNQISSVELITVDSMEWHSQVMNQFSWMKHRDQEAPEKALQMDQDQIPGSETSFLRNSCQVENVGCNSPEVRSFQTAGVSPVDKCTTNDILSSTSDYLSKSASKPSLSSNNDIAVENIYSNVADNTHGSPNVQGDLLPGISEANFPSVWTSHRSNHLHYEKSQPEVSNSMKSHDCLIQADRLRKEMVSVGRYPEETIEDQHMEAVIRELSPHMISHTESILSVEQSAFVQKYSLCSEGFPSTPPGEEIFFLSQLLHFSRKTCLWNLNVSEVQARNPLEELFFSSGLTHQNSLLRDDFVSLLYPTLPCPHLVLHWLFQLLSFTASTSVYAFKALWDISIKNISKAVQDQQEDAGQYLWCPSLESILSVLQCLGASHFTLHPLERKNKLRGSRYSEPVLETVAQNHPYSSVLMKNLNNIFKFLTLCAIGSPHCFSDHELLIFIPILCKITLDINVKKQPMEDVRQLLLSLLQNMTDWQTQLSKLCLSLSQLSSHHHNLLSIVQLLPDNTTRARQLKKQLSLVVITKLLSKSATCIPWKENLQACYLCHTLLTLANHVVGTEMPSPENMGDLQKVCALLQRHINSNIRESPAFMYRSKLKNLATYLHVRWMEMLTRLSPQKRYSSCWDPCTDVYAFRRGDVAGGEDSI